MVQRWTSVFSLTGESLHKQSLVFVWNTGHSYKSTKGNIDIAYHFIPHHSSFPLLWAEWAEQLTQMGRGKHFIGDFLPPDELEKFMETFKALKVSPGLRPGEADGKAPSLPVQRQTMQHFPATGKSYRQRSPLTSKVEGNFLFSFQDRVLPGDTGAHL